MSAGSCSMGSEILLLNKELMIRYIQWGESPLPLKISHKINMGSTSKTSFPVNQGCLRTYVNAEILQQSGEMCACAHPVKKRKKGMDMIKGQNEAI